MAKMRRQKVISQSAAQALGKQKKGDHEDDVAGEGEE